MANSSPPSLVVLSGTSGYEHYGYVEVESITPPFGTSSWEIYCEHGYTESDIHLEEIDTGDVDDNEACLTLETHDSYHDGWQGGMLMIVDIRYFPIDPDVSTDDDVLGAIHAISTGPTTLNRIETLCLPCGNYAAGQTGSIYPDEVSWSVKDATGNTLAKAR